MGDKHPYRANRCTAQSRQSGERCKQYAIPGGAVCRFHGGATPVVKAAAERRLVEYEALLEMKGLGQRIEISPDDALLEVVKESAGNVAFLRKKVNELEDGAVSATEIHVWVRLYNDERDRLARTAKMAVDAGIDARRVKMAEEQGQMMVAVLMGVFQDPRLGLNQFQVKLSRTIAAEHMRLLASVEQEVENRAEVRQLPKGDES